MNYYAQGGQPYGLKSLAQELPQYGRYGDSIVAHINPEEAMILKALGGSGTINPVTGLPEYFFKPFFKKVFDPVVQGIKSIQNIPFIKPLSDAATKVAQPIEKAIITPIGEGLASLDRGVNKAIPGGWGTIASVAGAAMGLPTPALVGLGALTGSGALKKDGKFNLQGALMGGATAYASAKLGDYLRAAAPGAGEAAGPQLLAGGEGAIAPMGGASGSALIPESAMPQLLNTMPPPPPSIGSQIMSGNFGEALSQAGTNISDAASRAYTGAGEGIASLGTKATNAFNTVTDPNTYTNAIDSAGTNLNQTAAGIKNLVTGPAGVSKAASTLSGVDPIKMGGMAVYGATSLAALDAQQAFLDQQKAAGNIAQAEYDAAVAEINRQRDFASDVVKENPFSTTPNRDVSIGETFYGRGGAEDTLYGRGSENSTLYAMGGSVDDESGMDEARGMMQGNMQKGLFGKGYAAGGQIDMGNGYNPFANLPSISGPLGAVNPQAAGGFNPFANVSQNDLRVMGGGYDKQGRGVDGLGNVIERTAPSGQSFGQTMGGLSSMFNQSAPQASYPSLDHNPNTNTGSFAGSNSFYGGGGGSGGGFGGGSGGAFPLEGQYGIVKMAAGGITPRFLSGGGDGMSDDIPATINGNQPARLADGEFVIPADVVSHIGNGSSKAGAKQLYSMMDKVRKARTGNPKQGKQINARKYLPA